MKRILKRGVLACLLAVCVLACHDSSSPSEASCENAAETYSLSFSVFCAGARGPLAVRIPNFVISQEGCTLSSPDGSFTGSVSGHLVNGVISYPLSCSVGGQSSPAVLTTSGQLSRSTSRMIGGTYSGVVPNPPEGYSCCTAFSGQFSLASY